MSINKVMLRGEKKSLIIHVKDERTFFSPRESVTSDLETRRSVDMRQFYFEKQTSCSL